MAVTPDEFKRRRRRLGLTQAQIAEQLGVAWNTVARWEMGIRRIPEMAVRLLGRLEQDRKKGRK